MTFKQLSFDDWLHNRRWCGKHRRHDCPCGRKPNPQQTQSFESAILAVMQLRAGGRVPVSSQWIAIQLLIEYDIDRTRRTVLYHLKAMETRGVVVKAGCCGEYKLVNFQVQGNSRLG